MTSPSFFGKSPQPARSARRCRWLFRIVSLLLAVGAICCPPIWAAPPNIVIVLADDMGYGDAGCYNPDSQCPTPNIDHLAAAGLRYTDAHAAGAWCTPSRYGLLTGRYAFRTSLAWQKQPVIAADVSTVANTLAGAGYRTAMVGKWHLGFVDGTQVDYSADLAGGPCDRGFDSFFGLPASLDIPDFYWIRDRRATQPPSVRIADNNSEGWSSIQGAFWRGGLRGDDFVMEEVLDRLGAEAEQQVKQLAGQDQPFFLYVPLTSPHTPWLPGAEYASADGAGMYSQFVNHTDAIVGRILAALDQAQVAEQTLVIFTSDNGPVWYDSDTQRFGHDSMGGWRGMKGDVWEAGHRVPFIVRWPGQIEAGRVSDHLLSFVDVHATLADLAGVPEPASAVDSLSFLSDWRGEALQPPRTELVCFQSPIAIRSGRWKLITQPGSAGFLSHHPERGSAFLQRDELNPTADPDGPTPDGQLYDLAADPAESNNVWSQHPDVVARLKSRLQDFAPQP